MATSDIQVRDSRRPGHFWADNELLDDFGRKIGIDGLAVYMALSRVARNDTGECVITLRQIATQIACSPQTVMRAINKLVENSLVVVEEKGSVSNKKPSIYTLLAIPKRHPSVPIGNNELPDFGTMSVPIGNTLNTKYNTKENTKSLDTAPSLFEKENTLELINPSWSKRKEKACDLRHAIIRGKIMSAYALAPGNSGLTPAWSGKEAKMLANLLRSHPDWSAEVFENCIRHRFKSEENFSDEPASWIGRLPKYLAGPLDKFGKPLNGASNGKSKQSERRENNRRNLIAGAQAYIGNSAKPRPDERFLLTGDNAEDD